MILPDAHHHRMLCCYLILLFPSMHTDAYDADVTQAVSDAKIILRQTIDGFSNAEIHCTHLNKDIPQDRWNDSVDRIDHKIRIGTQGRFYFLGSETLQRGKTSKGEEKYYSGWFKSSTEPRPQITLTSLHAGLLQDREYDPDEMIGRISDPENIRKSDVFQTEKAHGTLVHPYDGMVSAGGLLTTMRFDGKRKSLLQITCSGPFASSTRVFADHKLVDNVLMPHKIIMQHEIGKQKETRVFLIHSIRKLPMPNGDPRPVPKMQFAVGNSNTQGVTDQLPRQTASGPSAGNEKKDQAQPAVVPAITKEKTSLAESPWLIATIASVCSLMIGVLLGKLVYHVPTSSTTNPTE